MTRKWFGVAAAIALSGIAVAVLISKLDGARLGAALGQAKVSWLAIGGLLTACITPIRGLRYSLMLGTSQWRMATAAVGVQTFINRVTPMRLGELSLPYLVNKYFKIDMAQAVLALVIVRLVEIATVIAMLIAAVGLTASSKELPLRYLLIALLMLVLLLWSFRRLLLVGLYLARWLCSPLNLSEGSRVQRLLNGIEAAAVSSQNLGRTAALLVAATTVLQLIIQMAVFASILAAFDVHLDLRSLAVGSAVTFIGTALPVPSVGTVGPLEASWVAGFVWVGVQLDAAIVTGIAAQIFTLLYAAIIALPCWYYLRTTIADEPT